MPGLPVHHQLLKLTQTHSIESVMAFNHLILCRSLLLLPSIFPTIRVFSNKSVLCIRWPKYWSFSFSISPSNAYSGKEKESEVAQSCPTLCSPMDCSMPGILSFTISWSLLKFMSIESMMPSTHLICLPLFLLPSIFPSIRIFSSESALRIRWSKYWSFSFSISPSNEYSGLISVRIDWFALLAVQGTLKSLQHHSLKASILWLSPFFMVHLSLPYMTTGRTIALTKADLCWRSNISAF